MNLNLEEKKMLLECLVLATMGQRGTREVKAAAADFWKRLNEEVERDEMKERYEEAIIEVDDGKPCRLCLKRRKDHLVFFAGEYPTEDEARKAAAHFGDDDPLIW